MDGTLQVQVLGPVTARRGAEPLPLRGETARTVLARLVVAGDRAVTVDQLTDAVWGDDPPDGATANLQSIVSRLRRALGRAAIRTEGGGYRLDGEVVGTDLAEAEAALAAAHRAPADEQVSRVDDVLAGWRGEALHDVAWTPAMAPERARLAELRVQLAEARHRGLVRAGRTAEALPVLERDAAAHPEREPLQLLLLEALHASGRTPEALRAAARHRRRLVEATGVPPSAAFDAAERALLGDPPDGGAPSGGAEHAEPRPAGSFDRLGARLEAEAVPLVGRDDLVAAVRADLEPGVGPAVVHVHGPVGIGKSAVIAAATSGHPGRVVVLDGREVEPTPPGILGRLGDELGCGADPEAVASALADPAGAVLVLDAVERLHLVEAWLRTDLLPRLPATATTVLVARHPPSAAWRAHRGWRRLSSEHEVGPLAPAAAEALLAAHGLEGDAAGWAGSLADGVPLVLELASAAADAGASSGIDPTGDVLDQLVEVMLGDLDPGARRAAQAAAVVRRVTEPVLGALLGSDVDASAAWDDLRRSPLTTTTSSGLVLSDLVRDVVLRDLARRAPGRADELRRAAAAHYASRPAAPEPSWSDTADVLFLIPHPSVRYGFFPPEGMDHPVEPAEEDDLAAVADLGADHLGAGEQAVLARWLALHPEAVVVRRDGDGAVDGFAVRAEVGALDPRLVADDPVAAGWVADLLGRPLAEGEAALAIRWTVGRSSGEAPGPEVSPLWVELKRLYLRLRSGLRRVYGSTPDWPEVEGVLAPLGFGPLGPPVRVDDELRATFSLDLPPGGVDPWLAGLTGAPLPPEGDARAPVGDADPLEGLSPREREVLAHLGEGLTNAQLAERLFISERTVNRHLSTIFTKLGVGNRASAVRIATLAGLAT